MWAGKRGFLKKIQRLIDKFVWAGRSHVVRATVALPKAEGGLGLIRVEEQYNALTNNLMVWILKPGDHPLRFILQGHIRKASSRRWGIAYLTWIVSKCGNLQMGGSAPWQNLCKGWALVKKNLLPKRPANIEEWRDLPIWRPHQNHIAEREVQCSSVAQRAIQAHRFKFMGDLMNPYGSFITWVEATQRGVLLGSEVAF